MSNLPRIIAAVAHITDFPLERSEHQGDNIYFCDGATLVGTEEGHLITVSVTARNGEVYMVRVYGGNALYHNALNRAIKLDERNGKWYTMNGLTQGMAFSNLYDAMKHCGGIYGWF
ncbi:hypothetical protein PTXU04_00073 [Escherichia phage PTXU04]|uniref:Uncharacterized protein n=1 Tax=Escherichia phage PTXU04 TaxID=2508206 RepID=A0A482MRN4_9CAUD|nr:hypothetical protein HOV50_gp73 [Escherichia phage PTXU04]QBQ76687.1 hypothetical protein PTXU04_00073 [Escherichia phage PTXU04]